MLRRLHPDVVVETVQVVEHARCGDGIASTADRITLEVQFAPGHDHGLPSRMILKTLLLHPVLRFGLPAVLSLARASRVAESLPVVGAGARSLLFVLVGVFQRYFPHAPDPMYLNEVRFYTEIRPELDIEAPRAFGGLFDERSRRFGMVMEDLTLRGVRFPNSTSEVPVDSIRNLVATLARLHARFWQSPRLDGDLAWLPTRLSGGIKLPPAQHNWRDRHGRRRGSHGLCCADLQSARRDGRAREDRKGFGMPPGSPSLDELLAQGESNLQAPWLGLTGFAVIAVMLSLLVFIGEAVRSGFAPRKTFATRRRHLPPPPGAARLSHGPVSRAPAGVSGVRSSPEGHRTEAGMRNPCHLGTGHALLGCQAGRSGIGSRARRGNAKCGLLRVKEPRQPRS